MVICHNSPGNYCGFLGPSPGERPGPPAAPRGQLAPSTEGRGRRRCGGGMPQAVQPREPPPPAAQGVGAFRGCEPVTKEGPRREGGGGPGRGPGPPASQKPPGPRACESPPPWGALSAPGPPEPAEPLGDAVCPVHSLVCSGAAREPGDADPASVRLPDSNTCWMRIPSTAPRAPGTSPADTATALCSEADTA